VNDDEKLDPNDLDDPRVVELYENEPTERTNRRVHEFHEALARGEKPKLRKIEGLDLDGEDPEG